MGALPIFYDKDAVMLSKSQRVDSRLDILLDAAAALFASQGYRETTMRDLGAAVSMLPGSIYYHFRSKDELLVAVYSEGVRRLEEQVGRALEGVEEPWSRFEAAVTAHLRAILAPTAYARVLIRVLPDSAPKVARQLTRLRDTYEARMASVIDALPVRPGVDKKLLRFFVLGAANHTQLWFHAGPRSLEDVARALVDTVAGRAKAIGPQPGEITAEDRGAQRHG
ncbi:MAG: TetR/AcrR family transcriptional regulator [Deltaproteobacteria bacterium]|nr:TetR/AcrR family transcriptional regulator [Deltaproteobacteria bacterium]